MSINFCTLASTTVDTFCGTQRAKVLARLIQEKNYQVVTPPRPPVGDIGNAYQPIYQPNPFQNDVPFNYELPQITVTVSDLMGSRGSETLNVQPQMDFVTVTNLEIEAPAEDSTVSVNISNLEI